ncbi:hypothetical protein [Providencia alcalifaciens]|uniref:Uncharacterized protein n=1 Tax=Providencia alcalifaciens 205/92 TaxID=1256988 RepID=A0AAV3M7X5_9GAMM|nr:hypothetical protein [Providencia alcalifaciens]EUD11766.1 hypothetical protein HMPREF1563_3616 [Providencia alcalifaciens 205/92]WGZ54373.1 hypothetical protein PO864_19520 [Providencia alcalifaciens]
MILVDRLNEILYVEKLSINLPKNISWFFIEGILKHKKLEKYSLWLTTGKIIPEAGQISPVLAHSGHMKII